MAFSQAPSNSRDLNQTVTELYNAGNYDEAIPIAEQIVALERKQTAASAKNLVNALENLAQIRVSRFKQTSVALGSDSRTPQDAKSNLEKLRNDADSSETNLREAIRIADAAPAAFREQRIVMRNSLAWLLYNYQPPDPDVSIGFDKNSRDRFSMRAQARFSKRIDEASALYSEASKISSADQTKDDNAGLITLFNWAEFALAMGDLENALDRFERCIAEVEVRYGKTSQNLIPLLDSYMKALAATGQEDLAMEMVSRKVRITGKSAGMPKTLLNISFRAERPFAPTNASSVENAARANKERATLSAPNAAGGASVDAIISGSTLARQYYDLSGTKRVTKVIVGVVVDEAGKVTEAEAMTADKEKKKDAEIAVKEWRFRPLVVGGQPRILKGYVEAIIFSDQATK